MIGDIVVFGNGCCEVFNFECVFEFRGEKVVKWCDGVRKGVERERVYYEY